MAEFRVVIEGLDLDESAVKEINDSIQRIVLEHLAGYDLTSGSEPRAVLAFRPHPGWYGGRFLVVKQGELEQLPAVARRLGEKFE